VADAYVREGDTVRVGELAVDVWETPGHFGARLRTGDGIQYPPRGPFTKNWPPSVIVASVTGIKPLNRDDAPLFQ
jgi:hypothetical protein